MRILGMSKQYNQFADIQDRPVEEKILCTIFDTYVPVVGQGFNINFAVDINTVIHEEQIEAALLVGYKLSQLEAIIDQSGMSNHLHVWLHKIQEWE